MELKPDEFVPPAVAHPVADINPSTCVPVAAVPVFEPFGGSLTPVEANKLLKSSSVGRRHPADKGMAFASACV